METNHNQMQVLKDSRLRLRISAALSQAVETLPPTAALNLRPLLQQGQTYLHSVSSAALRSGLEEMGNVLAAGVTADNLLPMLEHVQRQMTPVQRLVAAPVLRPIRQFLTDGDSQELGTWVGEIRELIDEVLDEDALPPLVVA